MSKKGRKCFVKTFQDLRKKIVPLERRMRHRKAEKRRHRKAEKHKINPLQG